MDEKIEKTKGPDERFCESCGEIIKKDAVICPHCGVQVGQLAVSETSKDKTVAILLAIFLGFWAWIYTWEIDKVKFWVGLGVTLGTFGIAGIVFQIWAIVDAASRSNEFYIRYPNQKS